MEMKDIFGETVETTPYELYLDGVKSAAEKMRSGMKDCGMPTHQQLVVLDRAFNTAASGLDSDDALEVIEHAMTHGYSGLIELSDSRLLRYGESWKEFAVREAQLDPCLEEDGIIPL